MAPKILAITGSYRRDGIIETAVEAILAGAQAAGAETSIIRLMDHHLEFCSNCRTCTQDPGARRGPCVQDDELEEILVKVDEADGLVLGAPVNFFNVSAVFRRFLERLVGFVYWPWGQPGPSVRDKRLPRKSVLVASSAMPGLFLPLATGAPRALKTASKILGARPIGTLWIGTSANEPHHALPSKTITKAGRLGRNLV
jgi:hypothetical protein